jgi:hypothetical protein
MFVSLVRGARLGSYTLLVGALLSAACASEETPPITSGGGTGVGSGDASLGPADAAVLPGYDAGLSRDGGITVLPGTGAGDGGCGVVKAETQVEKGKVDVVWVIDDSGSMLPQVLPVGDNMGRFMAGVRQSGGDISVVMVTGPIIGTFLAGTISDTNYHWVPTPVQSWDSYEWAINAWGNYSQFLRPDAPLHFVFVTDDASNMAATDFLNRMQTTANKPFTVHAVATDGLAGPCLGAPSPQGGIEYFNAAQATGGERLKLCDDWGAGFDRLQTSVTASLPLPCEYQIPAPPNGQLLDPSAVQVLYTPSGAPSASEFARASDASKCADNVAWHFDNEGAPKQVVMCPKACDAVKAGGAIQLGFGCAPSVILR